MAIWGTRSPADSLEASRAPTVIFYESIDGTELSSSANCPDKSDSVWPIDLALLDRAITEASECIPPRVHSKALVAVVDNGIDPAEEERLSRARNDVCFDGVLDPQATRFPYDINFDEFCKPDGASDDHDGNDYKNDLIGTNLGDKAGFPSAVSGRAHWDHGTHISGLITGRFSQKAREVLAPRLKRSIGLRILNAVGITRGNLPRDVPIYAIDYALRQRASVANVSLGWTIGSDLTDDALEMARRFDLLIVAAAGNEDFNLDCPGPRDPAAPCSETYPSSYDYFKDIILSVAAHQADGNRVYFSNHGSRRVDLAAPGCGIESTSIESDFATYSGTSQAAAITSFGAALLYSFGMKDAAARKNRLMVSGDYDENLEGKVASSAKLNIPKAIVFRRDVLELKEGPVLLFADLEDEQEVDFCGTPFPIRHFLKITPVGPSSIRFVHLEGKGQLVATICSSRTDAVRLRLLTEYDMLPEECSPISLEKLEMSCPLSLFSDLVLRHEACTLPRAK